MACSTISVQDRSSKCISEGTVFTVSPVDASHLRELINPIAHAQEQSMKGRKFEGRSRSNSLRSLNNLLADGVEHINASNSPHQRVTAFIDLERSLDEWTGQSSTKSLRAAIGVLKCATESTNDATNTSFQEYCAAKILLERYRRDGILEDLQVAVGHLERAIEITFTTRPEKSIYLHALGHALNLRFENYHDTEAVHIAINRLETALQSSPPNSVINLKISASLSISYSHLFSITKSRDDITRALNLQEAVISQTPSASHLRVLSDLFITRLIAFPTSYPNDIERAIYVATEAVELSKECESAEVQAACLNSLGGALAAKVVIYQNTSSDWLRKVTQTHEDAVTICPVSSALKPRYLKDLANALILHFRIMKEEKSLDRAIDVLYQASKCHFDELQGRVEVLSCLANALISRFKNSANVKDLNKAIESAEKAVEGSHGMSVDLRIRSLRELGLAAYTRHLKTKSKNDLDRAIVIFASALALQNEGLDNLGLEGFLVSAMRDRFSMEPRKIENVGDSMRKLSKKYAKGVDVQSVLRIMESLVKKDQIENLEHSKGAEVAMDSLSMEKTPESH
jgi:tetratricopeptide (TPR) repeat protein